MVHVKFDKIHRSIRDYKLAIGRACRVQFLRTQLHSSYVLSLNYKPCGTGGFFQHKQSMLESFLASHSTNSEIWIRYRDHAFKMVLEDLLELDDESHPSSVLPTGQGPSMNDPTPADQGLLNAAAKRKEISPREELSLMKKTTGGFKLALKLMTEDL